MQEALSRKQRKQSSNARRLFPSAAFAPSPPARSAKRDASGGRSRRHGYLVTARARKRPSSEWSLPPSLFALPPSQTRGRRPLERALNLASPNGPRPARCHRPTDRQTDKRASLGFRFLANRPPESRRPLAPRWFFRPPSVQAGGRAGRHDRLAIAVAVVPPRRCNRRQSASTDATLPA